MEDQLESYRYLFNMLRTVVRRKWTVIGIVIAGTILALVYALSSPAMYLASATILPSSSIVQTSVLRDIIPGLIPSSNRVDIENVHLLYPAILGSNLILEKVIRHEYSFEYDDRQITANLSNFWKCSNLDAAISRLRKITNVSQNNATGITSVSIETVSPQFSADIINQYITELDIYNRKIRGAKAVQNLEFVASRLAEVQKELSEAEENLKKFRELNRNYVNSADPQLLYEYTRLQREVQLKNELFITLSKEYEVARITAKREDPVIQVLDRGRASDVQTQPQRKKIVVFGFLASIFFGVLAALIYDYFKSVNLREYFK